jgi:hypothetical protein
MQPSDQNWPASLKLMLNHVSITVLSELSLQAKALQRRQLRFY